MDIKNFLQSSYSKENFIEFIYDKFYGFEENDIDYETPSESEQRNIQKYKFLGQVELDDGKEIGFFEFISTENKDIENNRVSLNNILKNKVEDEFLDGAIAIFYNPIKKNVWRLSFIRFNYDEENKQQVSSLKRYTYVLGEHIAINTAYMQLNNLRYPTINELQEAFGVEKVSKEFFHEYKELYFKICDYLQPQLAYFGNENNLKLFTKKLLGRIVFLYFLEKKGWLGSDDNWENGDKKFLTNHFLDYQNSNFYNDILQPIFFEALNEKRENDYFAKLDCKMPFLNGGLFSRDEFDSRDIIIEDNIFKNIFDTFDSYNFTIIEDSPEDSEIAIDPEMLGRVFEDLLEDRKDKGAFYTPRPIVHYMCQQSIINYLSDSFLDKEAIKDLVLKQSTDNKYIRANAKAIQNKLFNIKVLDPAIGSGAFPMGMLHEIVLILSNIDKTADLSQLKRQVIENSIYGVDIEQSAVEIAKLRFWLSIVVDAEIPTPLPNLFYKIMVGNSLLETVNGFDPLVQNQNPKSKKELLLLRDRFHRFFNETDTKKKEIINEEIKRNINNILQSSIKNFDIQPSFDMNLKEQKEYENNFEKSLTLKKIIQDYIKYNATTELFLYKVYFKEVIDDGGFDVVIGNPPYVRQEKIKELKPKLKIERYKSYNGTADLYIYFFEQGYKLLKSNGVLSYITSNKYTRAKYGEDFRKFVLDNTKILEYIDFNGVKVFESATVDTSILTYKKLAEKNTSFTYCDIDETYKKNSELIEFVNKQGFNYSQSDLNSDSFNFMSKKKILTKRKIEQKGVYLKDFDIEIYRGIQTGNNNVFIIDEALKNKMIQEDNKSKEIILPIITGKEIKKYSLKGKNKYLLYITNETNIKEYSSIYKYLLENKDSLDKKIEVKQNKMQWYALYRPAKKHFSQFNNEKLLWNFVTENLTFSYNNTNLLLLNSSFMMIGSNLKYLSAILNSKVSNFYIEFVSSAPNIGAKAYVEKLIIPKISIAQQKPYEILVDYILFAKEQEMTKEASLFESIIDGMVYDLYFEEDMKKADCYITSRIEKIVKPFGRYDNDNDKSMLIKIIYDIFKEDKIVQRGLIYSRNIEIIKIINGDYKDD